MNFKCIIKLLLFFISCYINAQSQHTISGLISDSNNKGIPFANVLLLKSNDSTLTKGTITSDDGNYKMEGVPNGNFLIMSSSVGYQSAYSNPFYLDSDHEAETLILNEGEQLNEVVVEATKPLYQQKIDRMVINVENSIVSAGGSALEILERSPGVIVNRQSNDISVVGKDGVVVMIDGKTSYVPVSALIQMLDGMSADNIESIELITTPPSNLDAEGNAGFINIVMKKRSDLGLNGSYSLSAGYSNDFVTSNNINFNYRKNKINLFGNYSFSWDGTNQVFTLYKQFLDNNDNLLTTDTYADRDATQRNHNIRFGLDYQTSEKAIMGFLVTAYSNKWSMDAINKTANTENGFPDSFVNVLNDEINLWEHFGANYNFKYNFTKDKFISFDLDYLYYKDDNPNNYFNTFYNENNTFDREELARSGKLTPIKTWVAKLDYNANIGEKIKLETGIKGTKSNFNNDVSVENNDGSGWVIDPTLTNYSDLKESIFATYASLDYTINDSWSSKFGLRYEYTSTKLDIDTEGVVVDRKYGKLFPSIFFNKKINDNLNMNVSYSKRITRPTFNDMAPFVILFDPTTFFSGNASLQPAISNTFKYDINYKSYIFSIQYTDQDSSIANFQERYDEDNDRLIFEASNLDYTKTFSIILGFPLKISNWWRTQNNITYINQKIRGFYKDEALEAQLSNYTINLSNSFKFSDTFSGELTAFYTSESLFGTAKYDAFYRVNIGLQKKFSDKWGSLRFSVNDAFNSFEFKGGTDIPDENLLTRNLFDFSAPTFTLTYTRNFGNNKLKSARERETGAEEERQRVTN
ncbi:Outer membrane receptor proteins, mostly Fe transport [Flaviramulus basaltis]|uniref:Outer membrane receptor proteins, mostly Fe transport n=1 Tax=Flaviramulus basaltis TaxID=369401 RepID=A0A1K2IAM5_9FLAO|nr:outer membrane beta-barrel family protein [Flaviramulus basaltis]SFZ89322.1 Outer membrane receptor proteins, mostly Fe transport [Flaviramulus basaltis]